jgi:hypothetical protein
MDAIDAQPQDTIVGSFNKVAPEGIGRVAELRDATIAARKAGNPPPKFRFNDRTGAINLEALFGKSLQHAKSQSPTTSNNPQRPSISPEPIQLANRQVSRLGPIRGLPGPALAFVFEGASLYFGPELYQSMSPESTQASITVNLAAAFSHPYTAGATILADRSIGPPAYFRAMDHYVKSNIEMEDYYIGLYLSSTSNGLSEKIIAERARTYIHGQLDRKRMWGQLTNEQEVRYSQGSSINEIIPIWIDAQ